DHAPLLDDNDVAPLDGIARGGEILASGAGGDEVEHIGYGFAYPPSGQRMDRLDEALTITKLMFTQERPSFEGKYYRIERALNSPRSVQSGGPKILVGGGGEKRTLRLLTRHGDIGHWFGGPVDELKRKKQVFEQHCEAVGRDPSSVLLTIGMGLVLVETEKDAKTVVDRITS